jgi:hypothetical protein
MKAKLRGGHEDADVRRAVEVLELLVKKADNSREGSIYAECLVGAFKGGERAIQSLGYELSVSPRGEITWERKQRKEAI